MKNSIQIIVSTMNNELKSIDASFLNVGKTIIINQKTKENSLEFIKKTNENILWVDYFARGLSLSRNLGIELSTADYIYLTDDDVVLNSDFINIVNQTINENSNYDIYAFIVNGINKPFKKYPQKSKKIGLIESLKLSSVQLVFRRKFLVDNNIKFDEEFGSGSIYKMGEENILLSDCLKKGARILYIPKEISKVYIGNSSWFEGFNCKYFYDRGAIYYRIFKKIGYLYSIVFCIRKYSLYKDNISFFNALRQMFRGINEYKKR